MDLQVLPARTGDAAENMAIDFLLLQRYPDAEAARFRHYTWRRAAFTFGYAQKIEFVRAHLPAGERIDLTRRATGGGLVDHRADWTYALVLPRKHPLFDRPGPTIYAAVHEALAAALRELGADVRLQTTPPDAPADACFERPEMHDLVRSDNGVKIAGAALKRGKHAILLQGSIAHGMLPEISDWSSLSDQFPAQLAHALELIVVPCGWPEFNPEEEEALVAQYAAEAWVERR